MTGEKYEIDGGLAQAILNYLGSQPFATVASFRYEGELVVNLLTHLKKIEKPEDAEDEDQDNASD